GAGVFFFFSSRRRHTRFSRDWSSDVCSSDLRARVPMLPVVRGTEQTLQSILLYSVTMVLLSLLLVPVGRMGWVYLVAAIGSGAWFLWSAWRVKREPARAMKLFTDSTVYLAVLFAAVAVDVFVR